MTYKGSMVYIIGGSSGIGLSIANQFVSQSAHVIIFARSKERLELACRTLKQIASSDDQIISWLSLDASSRESTNNVLSVAMTQFAPPNILINCAGRAIPRKFEDISWEQFDETIRINLYSIWHAVSAVVPMMKQRGGYIVNVSSMAGFIGIYGYTDYSASKFAIIGLSESLRSELMSFGIDVSVLCPPDTDTPGLQEENLTKPEETKAISANTKCLHPDQVAKALLKGMKKKKFLIIPGIEGKLIHVMKRLFPSLVFRIIQRSITKMTS